jgi:hypothetical protein
VSSTSTIQLEPLHERIVAVWKIPTRRAPRTRGRELFLEEYSREAVGERVAPWFEQLLTNPRELPQDLDELVRAPRSLLAARTSPKDRVGEQTDAPARVPGSRRWRAAPDEQYDLVVLWKQNDTSIYGRRQDMFLKYLQRSGRFAKIVHFDSRSRSARCPHLPGERRSCGWRHRRAADAAFLHRRATTRSSTGRSCTELREARARCPDATSTRTMWRRCYKEGVGKRPPCSGTRPTTRRRGARCSDA